MPRVSASLLRVRPQLVSVAFALLCVFWIVGGWAPCAQAVTNLVFDDEFNGTNIDTTKWGFDLSNSSSLAGAGWGNNEKEYYTSRTNNAYVTNGLLHIVASNDGTLGFSYTSARLRTLGLFSNTYGRVEFRAKLPAPSGY